MIYATPRRDYMPDQGLFLPTTELFDIQRLRQEKISDEQLKEILIRIVQAFNDSNAAVNLKDTGVYSEEEYVNGQTFFPNTAFPTVQRAVFRKVVNFGALPNAAPKTVAHGITINAFSQPDITFTRIYGCASDLVAPYYIPIPFVDVSGTLAAGNIEIYVDNTNVVIETTGNGTNFTACYVVLEYIKT